MAKRMRLTPPRPDYLAPSEPPAESAGSGPAARPPIAPIAHVAGEAAATAALRDVADAYGAARAQGRLIQDLPLEAVEVDHLVRDRMAADGEEMTVLRDSLRARGQQTPIEVVDLGPGAKGARYGLISGWRRLQALGELHAETGEARFATVQALLRRPESAAEAYLSMVEENEVRVGLSYYERARIAARAAGQGVYPGTQQALRGLFAAASRSKRSKIASFLAVHDALEGALRFPTAIGERLGLALAKALGADPGLAGRLRERLAAAKPASAAEELAVLQKGLAPVPTPVPTPAPATGPAAEPATEPAAGAGEEIAPGVRLEVAGGLLRPRLTLSGPKVDARFRAALVAWIAGRG